MQITRRWRCSSSPRFWASLYTILYVLHVDIEYVRACVGERWKKEPLARAVFVEIELQTVRLFVSERELEAKSSDKSGWQTERENFYRLFKLIFSYFFSYTRGRVCALFPSFRRPGGSVEPPLGNPSLFVNTRDLIIPFPDGCLRASNR